MVCLCCQNTKNLLVCSHCLEYVCDKDECQISFPYYNNQIQAICKLCVSSISKKLIPLFVVKTNIEKGLKTLKIKIKTNRTRVQKKRNTL